MEVDMFNSSTLKYYNMTIFDVASFDNITSNGNSLVNKSRETPIEESLVNKSCEKPTEVLL